MDILGLTPKDISIIGLLIAFIGATARGTIRFGREYKAMEKDRDWWRARALTGTAQGELGADLAEEAVQIAKGMQA